MTARYDRIGSTYARRRQSDPRIARLIHDALGPARRVVNIGAGAGSYEPKDREVLAVEPSSVMIAQRPTGAAPAIQAVAEALPFPDRSFDAAMAVLTVHHWTDPALGCAEMMRVSRGPVVVLTCDPAFRGFWLHDYFPGLVSLDDAQMPPLNAWQDWLGPVRIRTVPVPADCRDGFLYAYWRRPWAYLKQDVRDAMSSFHRIGGVAHGLARLEADLASGDWQRRYAADLPGESADMGYRLVVARG